MELITLEASAPMPGAGRVVFRLVTAHQNFTARHKGSTEAVEKVPQLNKFTDKNT